MKPLTTETLNNAQCNMKETVNVNIASQAFTLDQDAYALLKRYLDQIRRRLPEDDTETMGDVEARIAEIFREKVPSPMRVVTVGEVREAMDQMGSPADFGPGERPADEQTAGECDRTAVRRLYRSRTNRSIAGICGGLAEYFDADPTLIRLLTLLLILLGGLSIWAYVILWIVIPEEPLAAAGCDGNRANSKNR